MEKEREEAGKRQERGFPLLFHSVAGKKAVSGYARETPPEVRIRRISSSCDSVTACNGWETVRLPRPKSSRIPFIPAIQQPLTKIALRMALICS